jgi:hypothetical protein
VVNNDLSYPHLEELHISPSTPPKTKKKLDEKPIDLSIFPAPSQELTIKPSLSKRAVATLKKAHNFFVFWVAYEIKHNLIIFLSFVGLFLCLFVMYYISVKI